MTEFKCLTNLSRLEELKILNYANFGDDDLRLLTALPSLKQLTLFDTRESKDWPSIVRQFPALQKEFFFIPFFKPLKNTKTPFFGHVLKR